MFENEKQQVLDAALKLDRYGLIALSGGNVSWRVDKDHILVTPSGMIYDEMVADDILVVDPDGNIVEGTRKASVDTEALLYVYNKMSRVGAIIHTHQPYATGLGLVMDEIPCNLSTLANATEGPVAVASYGDPGSLSMGVKLSSTSATVLRSFSRTMACLPLAAICGRRCSPACISRRRRRRSRSRSLRAVRWQP